MQQLTVTPNTISEGAAMAAMFEGFRKASHEGIASVIVQAGQPRTPLVVTRSPLYEDIEAVRVLDDRGGVVATAHMDRFDL